MFSKSKQKFKHSSRNTKFVPTITVNTCFLTGSYVQSSSQMRSSNNLQHKDLSPSEEVSLTNNCRKSADSVACFYLQFKVTKKNHTKIYDDRIFKFSFCENGVLLTRAIGVTQPRPGSPLTTGLATMSLLILELI